MGALCENVRSSNVVVVQCREGSAEGCAITRGSRAARQDFVDFSQGFALCAILIPHSILLRLPPLYFLRTDVLDRISTTRVRQRLILGVRSERRDIILISLYYRTHTFPYLLLSPFIPAALLCKEHSSPLPAYLILPYRFRKRCELLRHRDVRRSDLSRRSDQPAPSSSSYKTLLRHLRPSLADFNAACASYSDVYIELSAR